MRPHFEPVDAGGSATASGQVAVAGDGDLLMISQELATAMQYNINIIVLVVNNATYGTIRMHQEREYPARVIGTDMINPDFVALAEAHGAHGERVDKSTDFEAAFTRCLEADPETPSAWCREDAWRELTSYTPRPDSVVQLAHLYDSARAGTINLFPRAGVGYNSVVPGRHAGETFHFCCHVKDDRIVKHIPFVNTIRRHHIAHHDTHQMMERNFNLTYPFADWLFGTSDLKRGVLGHLFNGYSNRHVTPAKRKIIATSDDPAAGVAHVSENEEPAAAAPVAGTQ